MTKSNFKLLSPDAQLEFINSGGQITLDQSSSVGGCSAVAAVATVASSSQLRSDDPTADIKPTPTERSLSNEFDGYDIQDPYELLILVDADIASGKDKCHPWQIQIMRDFASCVKGGKGLTDDNPFQAVVRAANGSGKDQFIIASCAVWLCMKYKWTTCPVTSASGQQLDNQTCKHIKALCGKVNRKFTKDFGFPFELWDMKYREYSCRFDPLDYSDQSTIFAYATDEPKKAEGYHPAKPGAKMGIFVSEDKTVPDDINIALNKCTGYTHRLHVSTPGLMIGHFFEYCQPTVSVMRDSIKSVNEVGCIDWIQYHIPASKCSHLKQSYFLQMERDLPGGRLGAAFQSQVEAEFSSGDSQVVIPFTYIWRAVHNLIGIRYVPETFNTAGLDLSDGGDETVLTIRNGNKLIAVIPFKFEDTEDTITFLTDQFTLWKMNHPEAKIYADCGGIGKPMLNRMKKLGWRNIVYVDNRSRAYVPTTYFNRGSEVFFHMRSLLELNAIILMKDDKLIKQLGGRYFKIRQDGTHQLLTKQEQKSKGYPSPDRADSVNLCFWGYTNPEVEEAQEANKPEAPYQQPEPEEPKAVFDLRRECQVGGMKSYDAHIKSQLSHVRRQNLSIYEDEIQQHNQRIKTYAI